MINISYLYIFCLSSDGFKMYVVSRCDFNSTELKDIKYIRSYYYNKIEVTRFDSDVRKFVGFTGFGVKQAKHFNSQPGRLATLKAEKERYCQHNIGIWYSNVLPKSAKPYVRLHSTTPPSGSHEAMTLRPGSGPET
uniref:MHC class II beta chain N-terminal domain-containing protein n=1 Tax=Oreochromis niloticus TaxID=8128 RepID=A0A669C043_ORENI